MRHAVDRRGPKLCVLRQRRLLAVRYAKATALGGFSEIFTPSYVEDLDIGFRGWQRGWPTVFAAASHVTHFHRTTTARYFTAEQLEQMVERNYLRFLKHSVSNPEIFALLWRIRNRSPELEGCGRAPSTFPKALWWRPPNQVPIEPSPEVDEERILAIGSGDIAVFPGRAPRSIIDTGCARRNVVTYPTRSRMAVRSGCTTSCAVPHPSLRRSW